jgi:hypothetical protein
MTEGWRTTMLAFTDDCRTVRTLLRRPPACPREHSEKLPMAADSAHGLPFLASFLGGKHGAIDPAKLHFLDPLVLHSLSVL